MKYQSMMTSLLLGILISIIFGLAFQAGQRQSDQDFATLKNRQVLLDSKIHLIELKVDVVTEQKESAELQSDFEGIMGVLETSHEYTGEGIIARDKAMREAATLINESIAEGGRDLVNAIEALLEEIEKHLHHHDEESKENNESHIDAGG